MSLFKPGEVAIPIELPFQINPQGNLVLLAGEECQVFFSLWNEHNHEMPRLGKLRFIHGWASELFAAEDGGGYPMKDLNAAYSFLSRIENSSWLQQCINRRRARYPDWLQWDHRVYHHFVLQGHDNYAQVIAERYESSLATDAENSLFYDLCG